MALPKSDQEFQDFIHAFENGTLPKEEWHHAEHVAVAFWYLTHCDPETAIFKIRSGIQNLNLKHGVEQTPTGGYHETWTIFFTKILRNFIRRDVDLDLPLIEQLSQAIEFLKDFKGITGEYYSKNLIMSWEARTSWVEPDIKRIKF